MFENVNRLQRYHDPSDIDMPIGPKERNFVELCKKKWNENKYVCVGLDTDVSKIPQHIRAEAQYPGQSILAFNKQIIDTTKDVAHSYKLNSAFYEAYGTQGWDALEKTVKYIRKIAPDVLAIYDAKRGDIGNTNELYARAAFDWLQADAITVSPYLGSEAMKPFLDRKDKGIIILCRTSNPGAGELQDIMDWIHERFLYESVAHIVHEKWNFNNNCFLVVGATYPKELKRIRDIVGDMGLLVPGVGKQGGTTQDVVENGLDSNGQGIIINASRDIIFASPGEDFAQKAREKVISMNEEINLWRTRVQVL